MKKTKKRAFDAAGVERIIAHLRQVYAKGFRRLGGQQRPSFIIFRPNRPVEALYGRVMDEWATRRSLWRQLEQRLERGEDVIIASVAEIWHVGRILRPGEPMPDVLPSSCPDREESLMVAGRWRGGAFHWLAPIIRREHGEPVLGKWVRQEFDRCDFF